MVVDEKEVGDWMLGAHVEMGGGGLKACGLGLLMQGGNGEVDGQIVKANFFYGFIFELDAGERKKKGR